jgi:hypothetical protein
MSLTLFLVMATFTASFGKTAADDVYPHILAHLNKTATTQ